MIVILSQYSEQIQNFENVHFVYSIYYLNVPPVKKIQNVGSKIQSRCLYFCKIYGSIFRLGWQGNLKKY